MLEYIKKKWKKSRGYETLKKQKHIQKEMKKVETS